MQLPLHSGFHLNHRRMGKILSKRKISGREQAHRASFGGGVWEKQAGNGMVRALSLVAETFFNLLKLNRLVESLQSSCVSSSRKATGGNALAGECLRPGGEGLSPGCERRGGSAWAAGQAGGIALLRLPAQSEPSEIAQLDDPGDDIGGNAELVVENRS